MIDISSTLSTQGIDNLLKNLEGEMAVAVQFSADLLRPIAEDHIQSMGIVDTGAYLESLYVSVFGNSQYDESAHAAAQAYQFNETAYPQIRQANGGVLDIDPPLVAEHPHEAYLGVAASHGKDQEEGYVSFYGNDIPARPAIAQTAADGYPDVVREFREAILRAIR